MFSGETPPTNNTEINPAAESENPWQKMADEVRGENQSTSVPETSKVESEEYYIANGVEYRNLDKIDVSTERGRYEWIDSLIENCKARVENEKDTILMEAGVYGMDSKEQERWMEDTREYDDYQENREEAKLVKRQSKILENLDIDGEGGVLEALKRKTEAFYETSNNPNAYGEAKEAAWQNWYAADNLYRILAKEVGRRDPNCFNYDDIKSQLNDEVKDAENALENSFIIVGGALTDKGYIDMSQGKEKRPTAATEDAEIDLKYAKQDAKTFELISEEYARRIYKGTQYENSPFISVPYATLKADFASTIDKFIDDHTEQLNQLMTESKTLTKGTPEYAENEAKRKKLASERSSARRLVARYFNVSKQESAQSSAPESDADDGMSMEQMPAGKTKEQIEAEESKKRQEQYEETQRRMRESWEQKRQAEQRQREENERQRQARQKAEEERQKRINEAREQVINAQKNQANEEELEEENEMTM